MDTTNYDWVVKEKEGKAIVCRCPNQVQAALIKDSLDNFLSLVGSQLRFSVDYEPIKPNE